MDRKFLAAIGLMMLVVIAPTFLFKRPARPVPAAGAPPTVGAQDTAPAAVVRTPGVQAPAPTSLPPSLSAPVAAEDSITVRSGLYEYTLSTRGARVIGGKLLRYHSTAPADRGTEVELVRPGDG